MCANIKSLFLIFCTLVLVSPVVKAGEIDDLIPAIIQVESSGRAWVTSKDGCRGLMQLSRVAWDEVMDIPYLPNVYDPELNVIAGEKYLRLLKRRLGKNYTVERMLASYNMGLAKLKRLNYEWWRIKEAKRYVRKVKHLIEVAHK